MSGVPVAPIEDANHVIIDGGKRFEEADESMFVVDLLFQSSCASQQPGAEEKKAGEEAKELVLETPSTPQLTFNSGREDIL